MPTITSISPQKRKPGRFNIFIDDKFAFGLSYLSFLKNNLKVGKYLDQEEIKKIISKEELSKLQELSLRFLSYRPRSEKEVRDYLIKKISTKEGIKFSQASDSPLIGEVITKLKRYKYLDDSEFAKWFSTSQTRSRPKSQRIIRFNLLKKGITKDIIDTTLKDSPKDSDSARRAVEKKLARWQKLPPQDFKKKLYQYLASRGFDFETISETFAFFSKKS